MDYPVDQDLLARIVEDIYAQGYSVQPQAIPEALRAALLAQLQREQLARAGIGRRAQHQHDEQVRGDSISWIDERSAAGQAWLAWMEALKLELNRRLFLGLFSYESHFAHYPPGACYQRHVDAFRGQSNRVFSTVTYLNPEWQADWGGALKLYQDTDDQEGQSIAPEPATLVCFLSEDFPHEVLAASRDRYSIAGWFRLNSSNTGRVDPPR